mmetsp:Transcript_44350/g.114693  ORF Transcript_44350/g.114693 Transcript_44350/m.114693 type:complete len:200 (+) Transcript_44350:292-891(+)
MLRTLPRVFSCCVPIAFTRSARSPMRCSCSLTVCGASAPGSCRPRRLGRRPPLTRLMDRGISIFFASTVCLLWSDICHSTSVSISLAESSALCVTTCSRQIRCVLYSTPTVFTLRGRPSQEMTPRVNSSKRTRPSPFRSMWSKNSSTWSRLTPIRCDSLRCCVFISSSVSEPLLSSSMSTHRSMKSFHSSSFSRGVFSM